MTTKDENIRRTAEDWVGAYLYRTVDELVTNSFQYSPKRDLARAELHGGRLEKVIDPLLTSMVHHAQMADLINNQLLPELRKLDIQSAKAKVLEQIDCMLSSKVREQVSTVISNIRWLEARGCTLDSGDEAFVNLNTEQQEAFAKQAVKQVIEDHFTQLRRFFLATLNRLRKGRISFDASLMREACYFLPWRATLDMLPFASDPTIATKLLCAENEAVVEDREGIRGWGGDSEKAFEILDATLKIKLEAELKLKQWFLPGGRYRGSDSWREPMNDERELLQIGEFEALRWGRKKSLLELLQKGASGELHNAFIKIAEHTLWGEIRKENRRRGIKVPSQRSQEGKTEAEIREQVNQDIRALSGHELSDYEMQTEDGYVSTLEQAGDKQAFREWAELQVEEATALKAEKIQELYPKMKLTPRLRLVAKLYDKPNEVIAGKLERRFGKSFTVGAVRALKHDLLVKLKEASEKK